MDYAKNLLTRFKAALNLPSDYAAAKVLDCSPSSLSLIKMGRNGFSDETLIKIGTLMGENTIKTVSEYHLAVDNSRNMRQHHAAILDLYYRSTDTMIPDFQQQRSA